MKTIIKTKYELAKFKFKNKLPLLEEECIDLVSHGYFLYTIPIEYLTEEVCYHSVKYEYRNIVHVPEKYRSKRILNICYQHRNAREFQYLNDDLKDKIYMYCMPD